MRNFSDKKRCRKNQNTSLRSITFSQELCRLWDNV